VSEASVQLSAIRRADALLERKDYEEAIQAYTNILTAYQGNSNKEQEEEEEQVDQSEEPEKSDYKERTESEEKSTDPTLSAHDRAYVHVQRAKAYRAVDKYTDAIKDLELSLLYVPKRCHCYNEKAEILYEKLERYDAAIRVCQSSLSLDKRPWHNKRAYIMRALLAWQKQDHRLALYLLGLIGSEDPQVQEHKASILNEIGRVQEAIYAADAGIRKCGKKDTALTAKLYVERGHAFKIHGEIQNALNEYETAISFDDNQLDIFIPYALALYEANEVQRALETLQDVLRANPFHFVANYNFALMLYRRAYESVSSEEYPRENDETSGGQEFPTLKSATLDDIMKYVTHCLQQAPNDFDSLYLKAEILMDQDKVEDAMGIYRSILEVHPNHYDITLRLIDALLALKRGEDALDAADELLKVYPDDQYLAERRYQISFQYPR
jgi:tetratricopeptide (TPR) repeat protein